MTAQKKNFIIKTIIIIVVLTAVSIYMFTMRSNASDSDDGGEQTAKYITFHFNGQKLEVENKGGLTELPPAPKKAMNFFTGWYTNENVRYIGSQETAEQDIDVYAEFRAFESVINDFLGEGEFVPGGLDYVFDVQNEAVIVQNRTLCEHPFTNQKCKILFDVFSGSGTLVLKSDTNTEEIDFQVLVDFSNLDYKDVTQGLSMVIDTLEIALLEEGTFAFDNAKNAILSLRVDITSSIEKLIRHIANTYDYRY